MKRCPLQASLVLASLVLVLSMFAVACGGLENPADATGTEGSADQPSSTATTGEELFDDSVVHTVSVVFDQSDYDEMVDAYKSSSEKDWIEATLTIDGNTYEEVGMRLKGNSSLRGLANGREVGTGGDVSADEPQGLPWLIRLDKYRDEQNHGGITDFVIRSNSWATSLNEAVALELLDSAGLASERATYVRFTVNDEPAALRLATELPEDTWMAEYFSSSGALYKAEATGDYSYRGDDAEAYDEIFDQEAGKENADLTPLIEFLDFLNNSDDDTFAAELADRLDVDSFATYLAVQELIVNPDDIDGRGNNSYLYYDPTSELFTVVAWDHNLAFGGFGREAQADGQATRPGGALAAPGAPPGALGEDAAGRFPGAAANTNGQDPRNRVNTLTQRFHANAEFEALYRQRLEELRTELYESGVAADILQHWTDLLESKASDLVALTTIELEAAKISAYFEAR